MGSTTKRIRRDHVVVDRKVDGKDAVARRDNATRMKITTMVMIVVMMMAADAMEIAEVMLLLMMIGAEGEKDADRGTEATTAGMTIEVQGKQAPEDRRRSCTTLKICTTLKGDCLQIFSQCHLWPQGFVRSRRSVRNCSLNFF